MTAFALRAPWHVRERAEIGLSDPAALRPALQMYDDSDFARRIVADPRDSLAFTADDLWNYPVPVTPSPLAKGRKLLATWDFITTDLRKLYQPNHNRFYAVLTEVFCDQPGLPRAGSHTDFEVGFVVRRQLTSLKGARRPSRQVASNLMIELARQHRLSLKDSPPPSDVRDLWWADRAWRRQFAEDNRELIDQLEVVTEQEGWFTAPDGSRGWRPITAAGPNEVEETYPMWQLPAREDDCAAARTRSSWFGLVPTYSSMHSIAPPGTDPVPRPEPKFDDHAIYEIHCFVRLKPAKGHEHCPPQIWWNEAPTEAFRVASPMDPQGTSKRLTSITLPDLRRLAARAGQPMGPGGVAITTPPQSQLVFNPFGGIPKSGSGAIGAGGGICTFALELFFIIAFFLFLMFLPIVVFAFQLWWMLALRFCIPPSIGFSITADFLADLEIDVSLDAALHADVGAFATFTTRLDALTPTTPGPTPEEAFDQIFSTDSTLLADKGVWLAEMSLQSAFNDPALAHAAAVSTDPDDALQPEPPELEPVPDDPLCR
ncbi:MAG TPA: hypothetical protein VES03_04545 [Motilibacterales bacterium]|nr:hypothetical protein [Motilibacterales bacterium]